jgi:rod shape-determining protein MreD
MRVSLVLVSLVVAVVVQVSVLNGLLLPGGGVPDLVLVLVCTLAMVSGPVNGALIGFAGGLCLDLAPPGSELVGQYALVFCLAGLAAGRLQRVAGRPAKHSAGLVATGLLALVVAGGEVLAVAVAKVVTPTAVSLREQLRLVLPATIAYDLVLCPIVLSLVVLAASMLGPRPATAALARLRGFQGVAPLARPRGFQGVAPLAGTARSRRAAKRSGGLPDLHLAGNTSPVLAHAGVPRQRSHARLRPAAGVPGSSAGLRYERTWAPAPVHIRFAGGNSRLGAQRPGSHPGRLAGGGRAFRPHVDRPAVPPPVRPVTVSFAGHRGDGSVGRTFATGRAAPLRPAPLRSRALSFAGHRGDGSVGQTFAPLRPAPLRSKQPVIHFSQHKAVSSPGPQLRMGARRSAIGASSVPRLRFASRTIPVHKRAPAAPRFRRGPSGHKSPSIVPGGVLGEGTFGVRRQQAAPRLRLSRVPPGMLGGSGRSLLARPPGRARKQPRFSYGKRSPVLVLTGSRVGRTLGGRWLARQRLGSRSGVWVLGRRTGGSR